MKKLLLISAAAVPMMLMADVISPEAALQRAGLNTRAGQPLTLAKTLSAADRQAAVYVFANSSNSIVLSADDEAQPVLARLDGAFDANDLNPEFNYWMNQYVSQIEWLRANPTAKSTSTRANANWAPIKPLLTTKWDQSSPFNDKSPSVDGKKSWSGCVATALSQVMNYHEWPKQGKGSHSYVPWPHNEIGTLSCDFANTTFKWDKMADVYKGNTTKEQNEAVAELLYAVAVSVNMQFSPDGSGAWTSDVPNALVNYFDYDISTHLVSRDLMTLKEWEETIYDQLVNVGPVYMSGESDDGAHAFVCDGYEDGYYHINWGWGGSQDGYYLLTAMFPGSQQGAGGSTGAYNYNQEIIANSHAPKEGSTYVPELRYPWGHWIKGEVSSVTVSRSNGFEINGWAVNHTWKAFDGVLGFCYEDSKGEKTYAEGNSFSLKPQNGDPNENVYYLLAKIPESLADGEYTVTPVMRLTDRTTWYTMRSPLGKTRAYHCSLKGQYGTFTPIVDGDLWVDEWEITGKAILGRNLNINAQLVNDSENDWEGVIRLRVDDKLGNWVASGKRLFLQIPAGETVDLDYVSPLLNDLKAGTYKAYFINSISGEEISYVNDLVYTDDQPTGTLQVVEHLKFVGDENNAAANNIEFAIGLTSVGGWWYDKMDITIWTTADPMEYRHTITSDEVLIEKNQQATIKFKGELPNYEIGMRYIVGAWYGGKQIGNPAYFTIKTSAVEGVEDEEISSIVVYNLSGTEVLKTDNETDLDNLSKGIYVVRKTTATGKVTTEKLAL